MKLSFIPADLHLSTDQEGRFLVTLQGNEIFRSTSSAKAVKKFNEVKKELEEQFPAHELSDAARKELLQRSIGDYLVKRKGLKRRKENAARKSRTFG